MFRTKGPSRCFVSVRPRRVWISTHTAETSITRLNTPEDSIFQDGHSSYFNLHVTDPGFEDYSPLGRDWFTKFWGLVQPSTSDSSRQTTKLSESYRRRNYLLTYLRTYLLTNLRTYLLTNLRNYLLTYSMEQSPS